MTVRGCRAGSLGSRVTLVAIVAAIGAACSAETIQTTVGEGGFRFRTAALRVGDTLHVNAGVRYHNGSFVRDTFARYSVTPATLAQIGNVSGILSASGPGTVTISATLRGQVTIDTTIVVAP